MLINGIEYSWGDIVVNIAGVPVVGITAIKYKESQEKTEIYGAGNRPVARGRGRITNEGSITLLEKEIRALQAASPGGRLQDIAPFDITVSYIPLDGNAVITDKIRMCEFKDNGRDWAQGDTSKATELELAIGWIEWGK